VSPATACLSPQPVEVKQYYKKLNKKRGLDLLSQGLGLLTQGLDLLYQGLDLVHMDRWFKTTVDNHVILA
jgi:hypothetical protein